MHFYILVVAFLIDVAHAGPLRRESSASNQIILSYKTDTHSRHETGIPGRAVQGSYSYIGGDGRWYKVTYEADERGYRAKSEQLPWPLQPVVSPLPPVHHSDITVKPAPAVVQTVIKIEEPAVVEMSKEKEPIKKLPATQITWNNTKSSVTVKDDNVLKEEQPTQPQLVPAIVEPTEKLAIHVPLFTKVYSLKSTKSQTKHRKNKAGSQSPITRYKLSFLPAYGLVMH